MVFNDLWGKPPVPVKAINHGLELWDFYMGKCESWIL